MNNSDYETIISNHIEHCLEEKYVIYGTGEVAKIYYKKITEKFGDNAIQFFIDGKSTKREFCGKMVCRPCNLQKIDLKQYKFLLATISKIPLFTEKLIENGVKKEQIIPPIYHFSADYILENQKNIEEIFVYPQISKDEDIRIKNFLCDLSKIEMQNSSKKVKINIYKLSDKICEDYHGKFKKVDKIPREISDKSLILIWDVSRLRDKEILAHKNAYCCDSTILYHLYPKMMMAIMEIVNQELSTSLKEQSKKNYLDLKKKCERKKYSLVCGMGPSFNANQEQLKTIEIDSFNIVCNNFYNVDTEIIPTAYAVHDYDYCDLLRNQLDEIIDYVIKNKVYFFVPYNWLYFLDSKDVRLKKLLIGLTPLDEEKNIVTEDRMMYKNYDNVVPAMLLPIAAGINRKVCIIGCDGKNKAGQWEHSDGELVEEFDVEKATKHKKIFLKLDGINNRDEYEEKLNDMYKDYFEYAEEKNIDIVALAPSNYKEINKRFDSNFFK